MNRLLVEQIIEKVQDSLPVFKLVELFNNQLEMQFEGTGKAINFPALFISFPDLANYRTTGQKVQRADNVVIRLIIACKTKTGKTEEVLQAFDLKTDVYKVFNNVQFDYTSSFKRIAEKTDEAHAGYYVFEQDYTAQIIDDSANRSSTLVPFIIPNLETLTDVV
jgi:hypothetical protein